LTRFFDYEKSPYVRDRLARGHSVGRSYCRESLKVIRLFWEPAFQDRMLASITRNDLKSFSLSLPAGKSAFYKNSILNAGLIPLAVCCASRIKSRKIVCKALFYPANCQSRPDNRDFCVTDGAKIHKRDRLLASPGLTPGHAH
jgi:hypothetical protein